MLLHVRRQAYLLTILKQKAQVDILATDVKQHNKLDNTTLPTNAPLNKTVKHTSADWSRILLRTGAESVIQVIMNNFSRHHSVVSQSSNCTELIAVSSNKQHEINADPPPLTSGYRGCRIKAPAPSGSPGLSKVHSFRLSL